MAPVQTTEDYYRILEVDQNADQVLIDSSFKRLALKLHPDRNPRSDATEAFQRLQEAHETLRDESRRQEYDLIYPKILRGSSSARHSQPCPCASSTSPGETCREAKQIAGFELLKQTRRVRWLSTKNSLDSAIFDQEKSIRRLEREVKDLHSIFAAEETTGAQKNSQAMWMFSPLYEKPQEHSEEEKERQESRLNEKKNDLAREQSNLARAQSLSAKNKEESEAKILSYNRKLQAIQARIRAREDQTRQEEAREEREEMIRREQQENLRREQKEKLRREQQENLRKEQQAAEALRKKQAEAQRKQQAEARAAEEQKQTEEFQRQWQERLEENLKKQLRRFHNNPFVNCGLAEFIPATPSHGNRTPPCRHDGCWPDVQGRDSCSQCSEIVPYLHQCLGCLIKACSGCQDELRPRRGCGATTFEKAPPRVLPPSPAYYWD